MENNSGFSRRTVCRLPYCNFGPRNGSGLTRRFARAPPPPLAPVFPFPAPVSRPCPHGSVSIRYRNFHLLSIGYASPPRLRPRLTRGRSAVPRKPWIFGLEDSHLHLATHSGILSSKRSTPPPGDASPRFQCSSTDVPCGTSRGFGVVFQPRTFSARELSTSELLRTL